MKRISLTLYAVAALMFMPMLLSSCSDGDSSRTLKKGESVWIELQAESTASGLTAFANLHKDSSSGKRLGLPDGCDIFANNVRLKYLSVRPDADTFDFAAEITGTSANVSFSVQLPNGMKYPASIDMDMLTAVEVPGDYTSVKNGVAYFFTRNALPPDVTVRAQLVSAAGYGFEADNNGDGTFTFHNVYPGSYSLRYITVYSRALRPDGMVAGGVIRGCKTNVKPGVTVTAQ